MNTLPKVVNRRYIKKCIKKDIKDRMCWAITDSHYNIYEFLKNLLFCNFNIVPYQYDVIRYRVYFYGKYINNDSYFITLFI